MTPEKEISTWARALLVIMEEGDKAKQEEAFKRLLLILNKKRKTYLFHQILKRVKQSYIKKRLVEIFLAREHGQEVERKIKNNLPKAAGDMKNIEIKIDKDLIGGFRIKTANFLIKASVEDFLTELKEKIYH
jgi:F0F1-type ATP synthase delta subunit